MQLRTLNADKMIRLYKCREVTSHLITGVGSLFDPDIFGQKTDKIPKFGYINLKSRFIEPSVYAVASRVFRELLSIVDGSKKYTITDGDLILDPENGGTGIDWFYENFDKIRFNKIRSVLESGTNRMQATMMKKAFLKLKKEDIFVSKIMVLPVKYRDLNTESENNIQIDELNQMYINLIKAVNIKSKFGNNGDIKLTTNIDNKIQGCIQDIYNYMRSKLFGKTGAQKALALSRSVDNSTNSVIVAPEIKINEIIGKTRTSLGNVLTPLHHFLNMTPVHIVTSIKRVLNQLRLLGIIDCSDDDFDFFYTTDYIKEVIKTYHQSPARRFEILTNPDGTPVNIYAEFTDPDGIVDARERPLTWLEVFYSAVNMYIDKTRGIVTRYPVTSKGSIVPNKYNISTTTTETGTCKYYKDKEEKEYGDTFDILYDIPNMNDLLDRFKDKKDQIPALFTEATQFSNLYLAGLNGDYDGDRTNLRITYSKEAREQTDEYIDSILAYTNIDGTNSMPLSNECSQAIWNLTTNKHLLQGKVKIKVDMDLESFFNRKDYTLKEIIKVLDDYHPEATVIYKGINTTLGRVIFNEVCFHHLGEHHKFINETITKDKLNDILNEHTEFLVDPTVKWYTTEMHRLVLSSVHDLGFGICDVIASSLDYNMLVKKDDVFNAKKKEIFKDIARIVKEKDAKSMLDAEKQLVDFMKEHYKDNQMSDMYDSGCKPKWDNDFKTLKGSIGVAPIPGTGDFEIVKGNLKDGLDVEDMYVQANLQIYGSYNRAVETADGGYLTKKMYSAFQSVVIYNDDCKSNRYLTNTFHNRQDLLFRTILDDIGNEVFITTSNVNDYLDKEVKFRSPIFCKHKKGFCRKCCGDMLPILYQMDEKKLSELNVGLFIADVGNDILNKFMKKTHDLTQKLFTIEDLDDFIS